MKSRNLALSVLGLFSVAWLAKTAVFSGALSKLAEESQLGACQRFEGIQGPEDLERIDASNVLVSSNFHHPRFLDPTLRGGLILFTGLTPVVLDTSSVPDFRPHGIGVLNRPGAPGRPLVAVVNHAAAGDRIEVFELELATRKLSLVRSVSDPKLLVNANDVVLLSEDELLITHDHASTSKAAKKVEDVVRAGLSYVSYWRGSAGTKVLGGLNFANGLAALGDGSFALASMLDKTIYRVSWKVRGQALVIDRSVVVPGFPDNVHLDANNQRLWVALHHDILALSAFSEGRRPGSPSQVITLRADLSDLHSEFASNEARFAALSSALEVGPGVFLGNIYSDHLDYCAHRN